MNTCPVDCAMEDWQAWEPCDVTCGEGTTRRERRVLTLPVFGGERCGAVSENKTCDNGLCPVHCLLSDWTQWADCSISCTTSGQPGSTKRFRTVVQHKNTLGDDCAGELEQTTACSPVQCPVDCKMTDWTTWSDCSSTCGPGVVERQRDIASSAQYGGKSASKLQMKHIRNATVPEIHAQWIVSGAIGRLGTASQRFCYFLLHVLRFMKIRRSVADPRLYKVFLPAPCRTGALAR